MAHRWPGISGRKEDSEMYRHMIRQGDVLLIPVAAPADGEFERAVDEAGHPLAGLVVAGERTGHAHRLPARVYQDRARRAGAARRLLMLERPDTLRHLKSDGTQADHAPVEVAAGWWEVRVQREHVPASVPTGRWD
jgi:hypothetical protein